MDAASGEQNDDNGRLGEIKFESLCRLAKLHCSEIHPDRTGKDYIVESRQAVLDFGDSYDRRRAPLQVIVQVKTIKADAKSAVLSLSTAERLAKDLRPAVVCVFRMDKDQNFTGLHLIHLMGAELEKGLRALRHATASSRPLNKRNITFSVSGANAVDMNAAALLAAVNTLVGPSMELYASEKVRQLNHSGYDANRFQGTLKLRASSLEELADGFLGLAPLRGGSVEMIERRFGIDLPFHPELEFETFTIAPGTGRGVVLHFESQVGAGEIRMTCALQLPPLPIFQNGARKMVISWPMGRLVTDGNEGSFTFGEDFEESQLRTLEEWLIGLQAADIITAGPTRMRMETPDGQLLLSGAMDHGLREQNYSYLIWLIEILRDVRSQAGAVDAPVSLAAIEAQDQNLRSTAALLAGNNQITFEFEPDETWTPEDQDALFLNAVSLGGQNFALAIPVGVEFEVRENSVKATAKIVGQVATIEILADPLREQYNRFVQRATRIAGRQLRIVGSLLDDDDDLDPGA